MLGGCVTASMIGEIWWVIARDPVELMRRGPADDSFYYLVLAQHAPTPAFSSGILTTGFHPLYWLLLWPLTAVLHDGIALVRGALLLVVALHQVSGVLLYAAIRTRHRPLAALAGAGLWLLLPGVRALMLMGLETALLSCCLTLVLLLTSRWRQPTVRRAVWLGVAVGLTFLARTDSIIVTGTVLAVWAWHGRAQLQATLRALVIAGGMALAVALPWLVYLASRSSLLASDALRAERWQLRSGSFLSTEHQAVWAFLNIIGLDRAMTGWKVAALLFVVVVATAIGVAALLAARSADRLALALLGGTAVLFLTYGAVGGYTREWYLAYAVLAFCATVVPRLVEAVPRRAAAITVAVALVVAATVPSMMWFPREADKYRAALVAQDLLPADARVAAFNTGIYQFFMRQDVINLDGVVNPEVQNALQSGHLCDYLVAEKIEYILDAPKYLDQARADDPRIAYTKVINLSTSYDPSGRSVTDDQLLVTLDLGHCR